MKKVLLALLMFCSINMMAQDRSGGNSQLATLRNEKDPVLLQEKIKVLENGTAEDLMVLVQYYNRDSLKKSAVTKTLNRKYPQSNEARMARLLSFHNVKGGPKETESHFKLLRKEYPNVNMDLERNMVAMVYAEVPNAEKVME